MDDGTERLRGQLRETAQRGQASDYGGDRIEDTAARGAYQARRGVESLLKKKKSARGRELDGEPRTVADPPAQETSTDPQLPEAPAERPRIKTREAVSAREGNAGTGPSPGERMKQAQIKTRESVVHDPRLDLSPAPQPESEPPQIRTRDAITGAPSGNNTAPPPAHRPGTPERLSIKTRDACTQDQPTTLTGQPPQGRQELARERGRTAAMKRRSAQRVGRNGVPQAGKGGDTAPPAPSRHRYAGGQSSYTPAQAVRKSASPGGVDTQSAREGGRAAIKTAHSGRKVTERTARQTIKTAERSSRKAIKTTQRTAKTAQQSVKTAQAAVKATQRAVQTARATAKAAATTAKAAAKATVAAIKAAIAATQELITAIAAGGWVVLVVVLVICMIGLLIASPFGIFFSDGGSPDAVSPTAAIAQINSEYADRLSALQAGGTYDRVEIQGRPPFWADVFAVFATKTAGGTDGASVAVLDTDTVEKLRVVFWDMTKITTAEADVEHPAEGDTAAWTETVLTITVTPRTPDDMRVFYAFTDQQNAALDELLTAATRDMWNTLLYGSSGEIVAVALSQVGNVGGQPYWSWYGFNSRVEWCACFVSWCANECGYIDAGVIPRFAGCTGGSNWFKDRGQWQDGGYEPRPGDLVFFDWDNKGSSGPQDDVPDHVGIVERVENGVVYTVEGNSGDSCRQRSYSVGHYEIWGYGCPLYN